MVIVIIYLGEMYIKTKYSVFILSVWHCIYIRKAKVLSVMASNITTSKSKNIDYREEQSDIIISIVGLIIIIIWKITAICQVRLHRRQTRLEEMVRTYQTQWYSQSNSMVNVFGDSTGEEGEDWEIFKC